MRGLETGVEAAQQVQVVPDGGRDFLGFFVQGRRQSQHAFTGLAAGLAVVAVEAVQSRAGVGVDDRQRLFLRQVFEQGQQRDVFEHIGMVAGMEGVAVTEHDPMLTAATQALGPVPAEFV